MAFAMTEPALVSSPPYRSFVLLRLALLLFILTPKLLKFSNIFQDIVSYTHMHFFFFLPLTFVVHQHNIVCVKHFVAETTDFQPNICTLFITRTIILCRAALCLYLKVNLRVPMSFMVKRLLTYEIQDR